MNSYKIKSRIWIELEDKVVLGQGRVALLKAIEQTGSLSKAAKQVQMSYKKAWKLIDAMNKSAEKPVLETSVGGKSGGGAVLTVYGKEMVNAFDKINKDCWAFLNEQEEIIQSV